MTDLTAMRCVPCEGGIPPLDKARIAELSPQIPKWTVSDDGKRISRKYEFENYYGTMAFVNAIAWMAHRQDHHPDLEVSYNSCTVHYTTHAIDGLSENDFICAAKVDGLL